VDRAKAAALVVIELAIETFRERLADEQEIAMGVADMLIDVLSADSAVLRAQAATAADEPDTALHAAAAGVFVNDAAARVTIAGHQALAAIAGIPRATARTVPPLALEPTPINTVVLRRRLADEAVRRGAYPFASRADRAAGV
jgi:alkylation response protein AidB-like acyl-CoA dehydrogenase